MSGASRAYLKAHKKYKKQRNKMADLAQYKDENGVYVDLWKKANKQSIPHATTMRNTLQVIPRSQKRIKERGY